MEKQKKKASAAHMRATAKFERVNYFKTLVRFPAVLESAIRAAAGDSLNGYIVRAVIDALERDAAAGALPGDLLIDYYISMDIKRAKTNAAVRDQDGRPEDLVTDRRPEDDI